MLRTIVLDELLTLVVTDILVEAEVRLIDVGIGRARVVISSRCGKASPPLYPNVYFSKIASARLNALSTAAAGVMPFLMTSEWH
jgi:hypothetical protein